MSQTDRASRPSVGKVLDYNATLVERLDLTDNLTIFKVEHDVPLEAKPAFVAGQFVALGLNNEADPERGSVRRSMSLASAPEQDGPFEFFIRYVEDPASDNPLTHLLWKGKRGDRMFMTRKPTGKFTLPDTVGESPERYKIFVAAGTGLAPFVSMARSAVLRDPKVDLSKWILLHGVSYPEHLAYNDELGRYGRDNGLNYMCSVSRPKQSPDWKGDTGRVESYFLPDRFAELEERVGVAPGFLRPSNTGVLICGLQGTIAGTITQMVARGFIPEQRKLRLALSAPQDAPPSIWWEQYDKTPAIDVKDESVIGPLREKLAAALAAS